MPFLGLLLFWSAEKLLHRVFEVQGVLVAVYVVAATLIVSSDVTVDGAFLRLDKVVIVLILYLLFLIEFLLMLFLVFIIFFLVIQGLFVVIIESVIDLCQNIGFEAVQICLGNRVLVLLRAERLGHWHRTHLALSSDKVGGGEGLLEVGNLLLEDTILTKQLGVLFFEFISLLSDSIEDLLLVVKLLLEGLLVVLFSLTASHS